MAKAENTKAEESKEFIPPLDEQRGETVTHENDRLIETLQQENKQVKEENAALKDENKRLKGDKKNMKSAVEKLTSDNSALDSVNQNLTQQVEELSSKATLSSDTAAKASNQTLDVDGVAYTFPFSKVNYKKQRITITELFADESLRREMASAGILKPVDA